VGVKGRIRELVDLVLAEDVEWSDITVVVALGLEIGEGADKAVGDVKELVLSVIDFASFAAFEVLLEVVVEDLDEDAHLVISGAEVVLVFRSVSDDGDNVGVLNVNSVSEESEFIFESGLGVNGDLLEDVGLLSVLVTDDLDVTVVSIVVLGLDNFNVRVEV
jgi:hypothetical protein